MMSRKTALIILGVVAALCICVVVGGLLAVGAAGTLISRTVSSDPAKAAESAHAIADYTLPSGISERFSMSLFGISMVGFSNSNETLYFFLFQVPTSAQMDKDQLEQQMKQLSEQQTGQTYNLHQVGTQQAVIRGEPTELVVYEGESSNNVAYRQIIGAFQGKGGPAWIMIGGDINSWDQATVDSFISSLK
jgi:hypothetical protein